MTLRPHLLSVIAMVLLALLAVGSVDEDGSDDGSDDAASETPARGTPAPPTSTPRAGDADAALRQLFSDSLSFDQREDLFARSYRNKPITISGRITDVGTWFGSKYLTVEVPMGHPVDIFPSADFDLLDYRVGSTVRFEGEFTRLGTGAMIHHRIEKARQAGR